jgi:hypothetical protein
MHGGMGERAMISGIFQIEVQKWMLACFGEAISRDRTERNHRFLEEALELVQAGGCTASEAHQLVDYVFNRAVGDLPQEVGGVMVTLAALCSAYDEDMYVDGAIEIKRCWTKIDKIRTKQAAKPKHGPLPEEPAPTSTYSDHRVHELVEKARGLGLDGEPMASWVIGELMLIDPWMRLDTAMNRYQQATGGR